LNPRATLILGALAFGALAATIWLTRAPETNAVPAPTPATPQPSPRTAPSPSPRSDSVSEPVAEEAPHTPEASANGELTLDANGNLALNDDTRVAIEYLIDGSDLEDLDDIGREVTEALPPKAAEQALELMNRFYIYKEAENALRPHDREYTSEDDLAATYDAIHALRIEHFGAAAAESLFGEEERSDRAGLESLRRERNTDD
jgi:lipase chaperone LimK